MSLEDFKNDVANDYEVTREQREDANKDMRFIGVTGGMWEDYLSATHGSDTDRARMEFDMTTDNVMRYVGEWTTSRAGVIYEPDDGDTTDDDAELLTGVYRGDYRENGGKAAQDNAIYETSICGVGAIQLSEQFVDEEDPENEQQEIIWKTVHNAYDHVMFESNAKEANKSDASYVTKLTGFTPRAFEKKYPGLNPSSAYTPTTIWQNNIDWYSEDMIYIGERYEISKEDEMVSVWQNEIANKIYAYPMNQLEDVRPELIAGGWTHVRDRKIKRQVVDKSIFTGQEFIEEGKRIAGRYLPIVPVYGYRVFVGGKEYTWGLVRKQMDGNRAINTLISKLAETSAASANDINIYLDEQVDGREDDLADNTDKAYQVINPITDPTSGQTVAAGPVGKITSPMVDQSAMAALDAIFGYMQQKTGGAPQDTLNPDVSGKAVNALRKRENLNTQVIDNNIESSISQVGRVYRSKAGDLYTRNMMKKAIGEDGKARMQELNKITLDPQTGNQINLNDLSRGRFSVTVDTGQQYETEREATVESIERVIEKLPQNSPYLGPTLAMWMENISGTGLKPLKEFNRKLMLSQGLIEPESDEERKLIEEQKNQKDPQQGLIEAATQQQLAEAKELTAKAQGAQAVAIKDIATAGKTQADTQKVKAETSEIVVDINQKLQEGAATRAFNRFAQNTRITGGQA